MSKIGVALALCVLLLGATLFIGNKLANNIVNQGNAISDSLTGTSFNADGTSIVKMP